MPASMTGYLIPSSLLSGVLSAGGGDIMIDLVTTWRRAGKLRKVTDAMQQKFNARQTFTLGAYTFVLRLANRKCGVGKGHP